jgi:hypothetical protein
VLAPTFNFPCANFAYGGAACGLYTRSIAISMANWANHTPGEDFLRCAEKSGAFTFGLTLMNQKSSQRSNTFKSNKHQQMFCILHNFSGFLHVRCSYGKFSVTRKDKWQSFSQFFHGKNKWLADNTSVG